MSKHTPGPWMLYKPSAVNGDNFSIAQADGAPYTQWSSDVCDVRPLPGIQPLEVAEANAHLIAAAPEMLEALKVLERFELTEEARKMALDAIAKAEGK